MSNDAIRGGWPRANDSAIGSGVDGAFGESGDDKVGSGKFATATNPTGLQARQKLGEPPPAGVYGNLQQGPQIQPLYEVQEGNPIDGANSLLRTLSPFVLEMVPPQVLAEGAAGQQGTALTKGQVGTADIEIYGTARSTTSISALRNSLVSAQGLGALFNNGDLTSQFRQARNVAQGTTVQNWSITETRTNGTQYEMVSELPALSELGNLSDIAVQIADMLKTPPLVMLVNPSQMAIQFSGINAFTDRTRYGYVFQNWGEQQPRIQFSGKIGAFIAGERTDGYAMRVGAQGGETSTPTGVQFASKRNSASWQNFMALFSMYRNAGYIYDTLTASHLGQGSNNHYYVGMVSITYDQFTYVGHIESFSYSINEQTQLGGVEYQMNFIASRIYDNATNDLYLLPMKAPVSTGVGVPAGSALYGTSTQNAQRENKEAADASKDSANSRAWDEVTSNPLWGGDNAERDDSKFKNFSIGSNEVGFSYTGEDDENIESFQGFVTGEVNGSFDDPDDVTPFGVGAPPSGWTKGNQRGGGVTND